MNKIYKVIWSKVRGCYVVVSELAHSAHKSKVRSSVNKVAAGVALSLLLCLNGVQPVWAEDGKDTTTSAGTIEISAGDKIVAGKNIIITRIDKTAEVVGEAGDAQSGERQSAQGETGENHDNTDSNNDSEKNSETNESENGNEPSTEGNQGTEGKSGEQQPANPSAGEGSSDSKTEEASTIEVSLKDDIEIKSAKIGGSTTIDNEGIKTNQIVVPGTENGKDTTINANGITTAGSIKAASAEIGGLSIGGENADISKEDNNLKITNVKTINGLKVDSIGSDGNKPSKLATDADVEDAKQALNAAIDNATTAGFALTADKEKNAGGTEKEQQPKAQANLGEAIAINGDGENIITSVGGDKKSIEVSLNKKVNVTNVNASESVIVGGTTGTNITNSGITSSNFSMNGDTSSFAFGKGASADENGFAVGKNASTVANSIVIGEGAKATLAGSVVLGAGSSDVGYTVAAGRDFRTKTFSTSNEPTWKAADGNGAVSVGNNNSTRQIIHVAAGTNETDAVNVAQLQQVADMVNAQITVNNGTQALGNSTYGAPLNNELQENGKTNNLQIKKNSQNQYDIKLNNKIILGEKVTSSDSTSVVPNARTFDSSGIVIGNFERGAFDESIGGWEIDSKNPSTYTNTPVKTEQSSYRGNYIIGLNNTRWDIDKPAYIIGRAATEDELYFASDQLYRKLKAVTDYQPVEDLVSAASGTATITFTDQLEDGQKETKSKTLTITNIGTMSNFTVVGGNGGSDSIGNNDTLKFTSTSGSLNATVSDKTVSYDLADVVTLGKNSGTGGQVSVTNPAGNFVRLTPAVVVFGNNIDTPQQNVSVGVNNENQLYYKNSAEQDAKIIATTADGIRFGDGNNDITVKLTDKVDVISTDSNISVTAKDATESGNAQLQFQLAKKLTGLDSITAGNTHIANNGITIPTSADENAPIVSLTAAGLSNGNKIITNVASGNRQLGEEDNTNAANIGDVKNARTTVKADSSSELIVEQSITEESYGLGQTYTIKLNSDSDNLLRNFTVDADLKNANANNNTTVKNAAIVHYKGVELYKEITQPDPSTNNIRTIVLPGNEKEKQVQIGFDLNDVIRLGRNKTTNNKTGNIVLDGTAGNAKIADIKIGKDDTGENYITGLSNQEWHGVNDMVANRAVSESQLADALSKLSLTSGGGNGGSDIYVTGKDSGITYDSAGYGTLTLKRVKGVYEKNANGIYEYKENPSPQPDVKITGIRDTAVTVFEVDKDKKLVLGQNNGSTFTANILAYEKSLRTANDAKDKNKDDKYKDAYIYNNDQYAYTDGPTDDVAQKNGMYKVGKDHTVRLTVADDQNDYNTIIINDVASANDLFTLDDRVKKGTIRFAANTANNTYTPGEQGTVSIIGSDAKDGVEYSTENITTELEIGTDNHPTGNILIKMKKSMTGDAITLGHVPDVEKPGDTGASGAVTVVSNEAESKGKKVVIHGESIDFEDENDTILKMGVKKAEGTEPARITYGKYQVATTADGITFAGDSGIPQLVNLGKTVTIKGASEGAAQVTQNNYLYDNIAVFTSGESNNATLRLGLKKELTGLTSATFGDAQSQDNTNHMIINANGIRINDNVVLDKDGFANGGHKITNVASGLDHSTTEESNVATIHDVKELREVHGDGSNILDVDTTHLKLSPRLTLGDSQTAGRITMKDTKETETINIDGAQGQARFGWHLDVNTEGISEGVNIGHFDRTQINAPQETTFDTKTYKSIPNSSKTISQNGNFITGLSNVQWNDTYVSGRAATEDQLLSAIQKVRGKDDGGFQIQSGRSTEKPITQSLNEAITIKGDTVYDDEGNVKSGNIQTYVDEDGALKIELNKNLVFGDAENDGSLIVIGRDGKDGRDGVTLKADHEKDEKEGPTGNVEGQIGLTGYNGVPGINGKDGKDGKDGTDGKIVDADGKSVPIHADVTLRHGQLDVLGKAGKDVNGKLVESTTTPKTMPRIVYNSGTEELPVYHEVATMDDGLKFVGNDNTTVYRKMNQTLQIKGDVKDTSSLATVTNGGNIGVVGNQDSGLTIKLNKDINLTSQGSLKFGDTNDPLTIDGGTKKITGLKAGEELTDAVNVSQLNELRDVGEGKGGFALQAKNGGKATAALGNAITVTGDEHISTTASDSTLTVSLGENVTFKDKTTGTDKTTSKLDHAGVHLYNAAAATGADELTTLTKTGLTVKDVDAKTKAELKKAELKSDALILSAKGNNESYVEAVKLGTKENSKVGQLVLNDAVDKKNTIWAEAGAHFVADENPVNRIVYKVDNGDAEQLATMNDGLKFKVGDKTEYVKLNGTVEVAGDDNIAATIDGAPGEPQIKVSLNQNVTLGKKTVPADEQTPAVEGENGSLTVTGKAGKVITLDGTDGSLRLGSVEDPDKITLTADGKMTAGSATIGGQTVIDDKGVTVNGVIINATTKRINGLVAGVDEKDAVNLGQVGTLVGAKTKAVLQNIYNNDADEIGKLKTKFDDGAAAFLNGAQSLVEADIKLANAIKKNETAISQAKTDAFGLQAQRTGAEVNTETYKDNTIRKSLGSVIAIKGDSTVAKATDGKETITGNIVTSVEKDGTDNAYIKVALNKEITVDSVTTTKETNNNDGSKTTATSTMDSDKFSVEKVVTDKDGKTTTTSTETTSGGVVIRETVKEKDAETATETNSTNIGAGTITVKDTSGSTTISGNTVKVGEGANSGTVTVGGENGVSITKDNKGNSQITMGQGGIVITNTIAQQVDGQTINEERTISGLTNTNWDPNTSYSSSTKAATEAQLQKLKEHVGTEAAKAKTEVRAGDNVKLETVSPDPDDGHTVYKISAEKTTVSSTNGNIKVEAAPNKNENEHTTDYAIELNSNITLEATPASGNEPAKAASVTVKGTDDKNLTTIDGDKGVTTTTATGSAAYTSTGMVLKESADENAKKLVEISADDEKVSHIKLNGKNGVTDIKTGSGAAAVDGTATDKMNRIIYKDADTTGADNKTVPGAKHEVATLDDGFKIKGDGTDASAVNHKLNKQLDITGGVDDVKKLSEDGNIGVIAEQTSADSAKLSIKLAKDLKGMESFDTGTSKLDKDGVHLYNNDTTGKTELASFTKEQLKIIDGNGNSTAVSSTGVSVSGTGADGQQSTVRITANGLDNGGNQVKNVASGITGETYQNDADNNVATVGDLKVVGNAIGDQMQKIDTHVNKLDRRVDKVGAGAAALAALNPLEYDPDDKLSFAAGVGNYRGATAGAVGMYYRPDEKTMFSLSSTVGNNNNMVNAGISFALDKPNNLPGTRAAMIREITSLRENNATQEERLAKQEERLTEQSEQIAEQREQIDQLMKMVQELAAKSK